MENHNSIIVAMPVYNEESYIGTMVIKCKGYADEVLVVDDGSADDSIRVATLAGATVIRNGKNMGYGATIKHILSEARARTFDALVILDADTQHDPRDIPGLVKPILDGYDLVIGCRNIKDIPRYRVIGGKVLSLFTNVLTKEKVSDTQSGFRAYSMKAVRELELNENGMALSSEMVSEAAKKNLKITEAPISIKYTKDSSTLNPVVQGGNTLARILVMISKRKPLLFFGVGGGVVTAIGVFAGIMGYEMFSSNQVLPVGTILLSVMFLIIGILSIFTGIILNALRKD
jgi:glycosyltransferase involved in cell wall biosynthesis